VRANRAFDLLVRKGGRAPAVIDPDRVDHIEVVSIDDGEVVLFWDLLPHQTGRMARALRTDLAQLEADDFLTKWERYQAV
jgi:hypothetical protein